jgi:membrane fusion protein (multidrug efflux system)
MPLDETKSEIELSTPDAPKRAAARQPAPNGALKKRLRRILLMGGPLLVLVVGSYLYLTGGRYVSTDNAYVGADNVTVSAQVAGPIVAVAIRENQHVEAGQVLFRIDDKPYKVALDRAEAALRATHDDIESLKAQYRQVTEQLKLAHTNSDFAEREFKRQEALARTNVVSASKLDDARHQRDVAAQQIAVTEQQIAQLRARLGGDPDAPLESQASYLQAKAAVADAALDLDHSGVRASFAGIASTTPELGAYVTPGTAVMSVVADQGVWVEANFKETDLTNVVPGESVTVSVDTYPDHEWRGTVESISQATGAVFSVIPPQNATGNWVKVVQRIPVRIALADVEDGPPLRSGMSTEVEIDTGSRHRLRHLVHAILPWVDDAPAPPAVAAAGGGK